MVEFEFEQYVIDSQTYHLTFADVTRNGRMEIVAVTDETNGEHYVSSEMAAASEEMMPTATVPDNTGIPEKIETDVNISYFESLSASLNSGDRESFEQSLKSMGRQVLGPDSRRDVPEDQSSKKARKRGETRSWQGIDPEDVNKEDYPTR